MNNPLDVGFFDEFELRSMGFKSVGKNVKVSKRSTFVGLENITISNNVRVDDFSVIVASKGWVTIGSFVHIAAHCVISGARGVLLEDFTGISHGVKIYSVSDDYSGESMTNPMVPDAYKNINEGPVYLRKHVIIGSGSVILPGTEIGEGCSVGALSLVKGNLNPWGVYFGTPAKRLKNRSKKIKELEIKFLSEASGECN